MYCFLHQIVIVILANQGKGPGQIFQGLWSQDWCSNQTGDESFASSDKDIHSRFAGIRICWVWRLPRRWWRCLWTQRKRPSGRKVGDVKTSQFCCNCSTAEEGINSNWCEGCLLSTPGVPDALVPETEEGEKNLIQPLKWETCVCVLLSCMILAHLGVDCHDFILCSNGQGG